MVWSLIYYYENYAVKALREIGEQLKKNDWNFSVDPCENDSSWVTPQSDLRPLYNNSITCNCSYPYGVCHVVKLYVQLSFRFVSFIICSSWLSSRLFLYCFLRHTITNISGDDLGVLVISFENFCFNSE